MVTAVLIAAVCAANLYGTWTAWNAHSVAADYVAGLPGRHRFQLDIRPAWQQATPRDRPGSACRRSLQQFSQLLEYLYPHQFAGKQRDLQ